MKLYYSAASLVFGGLLLAGCTKRKAPAPTAVVEYAGVVKDHWTERPVADVPVYLGKANVILLFGLAPHDPLTLASATVLLAAVTVLAGLVPARRAMRVDPILALRYE